ncbi:hypothetical protein ABZS81_12645 [Streptomyces sp. NPDC005318]|uniref:hypothetical protein n=1 Tax=Streptomyces sp. NPDC005318 TaxID=3157031 RepID=UPI0033AC634A
MSTTRHLVNRRRRLASVAAAERITAPPRSIGRQGKDARDPEATPTPAGSGPPDEAGEPGPEPERPRRRLPRVTIRLPAVLCAVTVLLGALAAWSFTAADALNGDAGRENTALTDISRTSEVRGQITQAVNAVFSYNYAATTKSEQAAKTYLTGQAVQQHREMLAQVRTQAPKQKLVLTTTVTGSGVEFLDGDRARLLIFADQSNTRTGASGETAYAAAMFAVDAVRRGDTWRISAIDTFTQ